MASLFAKSPADKLLPVRAGGVTLSEVWPDAITSIAPFNGQHKTVSAALKEAHGMELPAPGRATGKSGGRCVWTGQGQAMLVGPAPVALTGAALTDQTDAWVVVRIEGEAVEAVLARLVPVDLRASVFKSGHTARTMLGHMALSVTRTGAQAFDLMVFRSMAATAVHELHVAMKSVAAQD